jgi:acetyl esterase/lipase
MNLIRMRDAMIAFTVSCLFTACASFPSSARYQARETRGLVYKTVSGLELKADIFSPVGVAGAKPAVLVVHGGSWGSRSGDMEWICRDLARAGFVAVNITYRLAPKFRFPAPVEDVRDAGAWIHAHAAELEVDPKRVAAWGYSAGANLVLLAALDPSAGFRAVVAGGTPANLVPWPDSPVVNDYLGEPLAGHEALWMKASPVNSVRTDSPPVFLYHGASDKIVSSEQEGMMEEALRQKGVPHESYLVPHMGHFLVYLFSQESFERGADFLKRKLAL